MAEAEKKKPQAAPAAAAPAAEKHDKDKKDAPKPAAAPIWAKTPVLIGGVMILEAVVLLVGVKFLGGGGPKTAAGADLVSEEHGGHGGEGGEGGDAKHADKKTPVEISVAEFRAPNKQSGRTFLYDVSLYISTKAEHEQKVKDALAAQKNKIQDRLRTIIAQSDPEKLGGGSEPGLETLRRQIKYQLDEIVGEGLIDEVLIPRCIPFRADY